MKLTLIIHLQILVQHIKAVLPGLKSRISSALVSVAKEHASYGEITESKVCLFAVKTVVIYMDDLIGQSNVYCVISWVYWIFVLRMMEDLHATFKFCHAIFYAIYWFDNMQCEWTYTTGVALIHAFTRVGNFFFFKTLECTQWPI